MASGSLSGSTGSLGPTPSNIVTLTGGNSASVLHGEGKTLEVVHDEWLAKIETQHVARADMNKLIMNYLVTEGFKEAAEKFQKESGLETAVDMDSIDLRIKIKELILQGDIQEAIALVNDVHPELLDNDRYLYFHLQQQQLIELIREKQVEEALEFAQIHLAERGEENPAVLSELERSLALLAFESPDACPFNDLLHPCQRQKVATELNAAILAAENKDSVPKISNLLKLLLWAQNELDSKKVVYPKMVNLAEAKIQMVDK